MNFTLTIIHCWELILRSEVADCTVKEKITVNLADGDSQNQLGCELANLSLVAIYEPVTNPSHQPPSHLSLPLAITV